MSNAVRDPKKDAAAQNAQEGLITVADLSVLTGLPPAQLTKYAKTGLLNHYGEYHGKRFFKFEEVVAWASESADGCLARAAVRAGLEAELSSGNCPYAIHRVSADDGSVRLKVVWLDAISVAA